jgi:ABC-type transport system involved in cytochrome bd biosynthesis fused ATPase/permease subunit
VSFMPVVLMISGLEDDLMNFISDDIGFYFSEPTSLLIIFLSFTLLSALIRYYSLNFIHYSVFNTTVYCYELILKNRMLEFSPSTDAKTMSVDMLTTKLNDFNFNFLMPVALIINNTILVFIILAALIFIDHAITISAFALVFITYISVVLVLRKKLQKDSEIIKLLTRSVLSKTSVIFNVLREIEVYDVKKAFVDDASLANSIYRKSQQVNYTRSVAPRYFVEALVLSGITLVALFGAKYGDDKFIIAKIGLLGVAVQRLLPLLQGLYNSVTTLSGFYDSSMTIVTEVNAANETLRRSSLIEYSVEPRYIKTDKLVCGYSNSTFRLHVSDTTILPGDRIGVEGQSGSGKTSFLLTLLGFLPPISGKIFVSENGQDWCELTKVKLKNVAYMPQTPELIDGTLENNIRFKREVESDAVEKLIGEVGLTSVQERTRDRFEVDDSDCTKLSGGQKQRVTLSRALFSNPKIVFIDEGTSMLDSGNAENVIELINKVERDAIVVQVSHRKTAFKHCNRRFIVDGDILNERT